MAKKLIYGAGGCYEAANTKADQDIIDSLKDPWHSNVKENDDDDDRSPFKMGGTVCKKKAGGKLKISITHPGALHKEMGVPKGDKIPMGALKSEKAKAKKTGNAKLMKQVTFAENARIWKKK